MDEISKIGDINSVNDLFDFKLSIKTIVFLALGWGAVCLVIIVFLFGGVNNTVAYFLNISETIKSNILESRNKKINKHSVEKKPADINTDKNND